MDTSPQNEPEQVRLAIAECIEAGTISADLAALVHRMAARRCSPYLAEDIAQTVLLGLHRQLSKLDLGRDVYSYLCVALAKVWRHIMRGRRAEQRYLLHLMGEIVQELPPGLRSRYRGRMLGAALRKFKYY